MRPKLENGNKAKGEIEIELNLIPMMLRRWPQQSPWMEIRGFVKEEGVGGSLG